MRKNLLFWGVIGILILLEALLFLFYGGGFAWLRHITQRQKNIPGIILFEGNNCSHCQTVENFIKNNAIDKKVAFTRLEVFNNTANANILADKSQICGLNPQQIGVPFLWDGSHCILGDMAVIKFFQQKIR
jgi:hypothetical protein